MNGDRDDLVGDALRRLDVPDHGPAFYSELSARLAREATQRPRSRGFRWNNPYMLATAAAAVAAVVLASSLVTSGGSTRLEPQLISASTVRSRVATAFASIETLRGEIAVKSDGTTRRWSFVTTAAGDERVTGIGFDDDSAFDSANRVWREVLSFDGHKQATEISNPGAGIPDAFARSPLRRNLGAVVRAFVSDTSNVPVTEVVEDGRNAWRLVMAVTPNKLAGPGRSADQLEVVVDRDSGFPLRITESVDNRFLTEVRLSRLVTDAPASRSEFVLPFPPGLKVFRQDAGFKRVTVSEAAGIVGYQPILPTHLPDGFKMAEVTAASQGGATGNEGANPEAAGVVSVAYRRGFDRIIVTTRLRGGVARCDQDGTGSSACWADPVASGEGFFDEPRPFTITRGGLAGTDAELVVSPRGVPHVWVLGQEFVVTIAGDASSTELRRIAASFTQRAASS